MKIGRPHLLAVFVAGLLAPMSAFGQSAPQRVISSIDIRVLNVSSVVVGKIAKAVPGADSSVDISIAVDEVLKGDPRAAQQRHQVRGQNGRFSVAEFSRMSDKKTRVLIIGELITPLDQKRMAIPAASGVVLREPDQIVDYIRQVIREHPGVNRVDGFAVPLPKQFQNIDFGSFDVGSLGPPRDFIVPVDARLEEWALEGIRSRPKDVQPVSSYSSVSGVGPLRSRPEDVRAFDALSHFKSDSNMAFLEGLLNDPAFFTQLPETNNGIEVRTYYLRDAAYEILKKWGTDIGQPVLREEVPRFETLESFDWQPSTTDAVLQKVMELSRNLKRFSAGIYSHPSEQQIARIGEISSLTSVSLNGSNKTDAMVSHLSNSRNLENLDLGNSRVTDNGLGFLLSLPNLRSIDVTQTRITDDGLRLLGQMKGLKTVNVALTQVTEKVVAEMRILRPDLDVAWERSSNGQEPSLFELAQWGDLDGIRKFLRDYADGSVENRVNTPNYTGNTPLIYAVAQNRYDVVKFFLDKGAKVDYQDLGKATALEWSVRHGYDKMAALLLDRGANVNHRDEDGNTALHFATRKGRTELVRLLLSRGASVLSRNGAGDTPLDLASRAGHPPVLELLKSASSR